MLGRVAEAQAEHHTAADPIVRYIELLVAAIAAGHAHLASPDGRHPQDPGAWGWRERTIGHQSDEWQPQGDRVGWLSGDEVFLEPDAMFQNLRSTRHTELEEIFPSHVVCGWLGNSRPVAAKHYLQITDAHFAKAVQNPVQLGQKAVQYPAVLTRKNPVFTAPYDTVL